MLTYADVCGCAGAVKQRIIDALGANGGELSAAISEGMQGFSVVQQGSLGGVSGSVGGMGGVVTRVDTRDLSAQVKASYTSSLRPHTLVA